jgi:hypothetical protein
MRQDGDCRLQSGRALAFCDQESKEHPKSSRAHLCAGPSRSPTDVQYKLPQALGIELFRLLSDALEQSADVVRVIHKGRFMSATLLAHPPTELGQERRILDEWPNIADRDQAYILQVLEEQPSAVKNVHAV